MAGTGGLGLGSWGQGRGHWGRWKHLVPKEEKQARQVAEGVEFTAVVCVRVCLRVCAHVH